MKFSKPHRQAIFSDFPVTIVETMLFEKSKNLTHLCDPEILHSCKTLALDFDVANRLTAVKNIPESITTSYTYDAADNLKTITDAENKVTTFDYDNRDRKTSKTYPGETAVIDYDYDANSNLTDIDLPNGTHITYTYDDLNRQTNQSYTGNYGTASVTYTLDGNGNIEQVDEVIEGQAYVYNMAYDDFDRMERKTDRYGNSFDYSYDANGNRKVFKDQTNQLTSYTYDKLNRLKQMTNPSTGAFDWSYNSAGLPDQLDYPNGSQANYTYDNANRIDVIDNKQSGVTVTQHDYDYDLNGNRIKLTESNIDAAQITSYEYDEADRLVKVYYPTTINSYTLDKVGNRELEVIDTGGVLTTRDYDYNNRDQLITITDDTGLDVSYDYDAAGNQTEKTENGVTTVFDYSARQRVKSITIGAQSPIEYQYDHSGQRIKQQNSGAEKRYLYDGLALIAETNTLGNTIARYHYGIHHQIAETRNTQSAFYLNDSLGTTVAITNQDGSIQNRMDYDVWGNLNQETSTSQSPFGFTGYIKDEETDLYYANARYYDSFTGRFLREDPLEGQTNNPPSLHRYTYAYANPTYFVDPDGRYAEAGHYYTTLIVAEAVGFSAEDAMTLAFFSQLPDEVDEFDAIELKKGELYSKRNREIFNVRQPLFHALVTGGDSEFETSITKRAILSLGDDFQGIGFLIHRLGDTYAHRQIDNEGKLYSTGYGHFKHGTRPDVIQYRPELYREYVTTLTKLLAEVKGVDPENVKAMVANALSKTEKLIDIETTTTRQKYWKQGEFLMVPNQPKTGGELQDDSVRVAREVVTQINIEREQKGIDKLKLFYRPELNNIKHMSFIDKTLNQVLVKAIKDSDHQISTNSISVNASLNNASSVILNEYYLEWEEFIKSTKEIFIVEGNENRIEGKINE